MLLSKCVACISKKSKIFIEQGGRRLISNLKGIEVLILNDLLILNILVQNYKINEIVNKL